ncbi:hypothetical protein [Kingella negevensis]|uniref:hypothetical protein n=1 Tax=Kingella negevensis TaxID=1522312 RepID=UPI00050A2A5C|nr:hypothetical protein [Kingella negevensis]MDK4688541.1 hypothetical protein [Kingella negevensis]
MKTLIPYKERVFDAQTYLNEIKNKQDNIEKVEFIPPKLGKGGYGLFRVRYKIPVLVGRCYWATWLV